MAKLPEPSKDIAARILAEVPFDRRLMGFRMTPRAGNTPMALYAFEEAVKFLHVDSLEDLLTPGGKGSVGYIDLGALKEWVEEVMGDKDLAAAIGEVIAEDSNYHDQANTVQGLMAERLSQCKHIVKT